MHISILYVGGLVAVLVIAVVVWNFFWSEPANQIRRHAWHAGRRFGNIDLILNFTLTRLRFSIRILRQSLRAEWIGRLF